MPSITLNKERVKKLVGREVSDEILKEKISYLGTDLEKITKDEIIVEIFPNRPDLLSEEGFARALKTFLGFEKGLRKYKTEKSNYEVIVHESVKEVRPYTACLVAKNLKITEEELKNIINIQEKLHITYGRNRKKCAIGIYPMENINFPIQYKAIEPEKILFVPIGEKKIINGYDLLSKTKTGKEYGYLLKNQKKFPVFIDSKKIIMSVPPILNSKHTGTVNTETKNLFVECSGHNFKIVSKALNIIATALSDMNAKIYEVTIKYEKENKKIITPNFEPDKINVDINYINKYLGLNLTEKEIIHLIEKMGFGINNIKKEIIEILIPCYRADILHQVDIVEDICIAYGFDKIKEEKYITGSTGKEIYREKVEEKIRDILIGDGLLENINYSLVKEEEQKKIGLKKLVKIKNPTSSEYNSMRRYLFISLLKTMKNNKMNEYPQKIFEIGKTFKKIDNKEEKNNKEEKKEENKTIIEEKKLCVSQISNNSNYTWAKQRLELLKNLFELEIKYEQKEYDFFIKGRSAEIKIINKKEKQTLGFIGEINLDVLRLYELEHPVSLFEINIDLLSKIIEENNKNK